MSGGARKRAPPGPRGTCRAATSDGAPGRPKKRGPARCRRLLASPEEAARALPARRRHTMGGSAPQPPRRWRPNTTAGQLLPWGVQQCKFHARSTVRARAPPRAAAARLQTLESVNRESGKEPAKRRGGLFSSVGRKSYFSIPRDLYNTFRYDPRRVLRATPGLRKSAMRGSVSVLGACGMHGAVGAGRRRGRSWMQGHVLPAVIQAAAGRGAARPRPEDTRSLDSPFCGRRDACPELALRQTWCSPAGQLHG